MVDIEYANAYSEVLEILNYIPKEDYNKIDKNKIDLFEINSNKNYKFIYNPNITLEDQNISKRAKAIIAILFRDYWATPFQRDKIIAKQNYDLQKLEKEKRENYNPDDIFKNKKSKVIDNTVDTTETTSIALVQEKWYKKLFKFIKNLRNHIK